MEIIKELNKDDGMEFIKNGSITHAMNVVVSKDGNSIRNEKSFETIVTLDSSIKIVGIVPCAVELVIFCDNNDIYRYNESTGATIKIPAVWKWYGGEVFGTYTYNVRGDLIVAISERNAINDVPLKIINISHPEVVDDEMYTLNPTIVFPIVDSNEIVSGGKSRCGTYILYYRYKTAEDEYTGWRNLGLVIKLEPQLDNEIVSSITVQGYKNNTKNMLGTYYLTDIAAPKKVEYVSKSFSVKVRIHQSENKKRYDYVQFAYVCTYNGGTEAYNLGDMLLGTEDIGTSLTVTNNIAKTELAVNDVLISANSFNLYNVKTLCNYNNRLYVANYKESNRNADIAQVDTSNVRVALYQKKDWLTKSELPVNYPRPLEGEVYRFYLHYVYPDGTYTDGILIENNNWHKVESDGTVTKLDENTIIGKYVTSSTTMNVYKRFTEDTKVSDVKAAIEKAKTGLATGITFTIDPLVESMIQISDLNKVDYYWFNLSPKFKIAEKTDSAKPDETLLCPYTNNNGKRLFRMPDKITGNLVFHGIHMYPEFAGYFISYSKIDGIVLATGIVDQHKDYTIDKYNMNIQSSSVSTGYSAQFYSDDIYIKKKGGTPNMFVDLAYGGFIIRDTRSSNDYSFSKYLALDNTSSKEREYTFEMDTNYENTVNTSYYGCTGTLKSTSAGQYYAIIFRNTKSLTPTATTDLGNGNYRKMTTIGRLLEINQNIYMNDEDSDLIQLGPVVAQSYVPAVTPRQYDWGGRNDFKYNNLGYNQESKIFIFDNQGVKFAGELYPTTDYNSAVDSKSPDIPYYNQVYESLGVIEGQRDMMHVNAVRLSKQVSYNQGAKILVNPLQDIYYSYRDQNEDTVRNVANRQLTAVDLYNMFELAAMYSDYSKSILITYNPKSVGNQIESYGKFIRRSNVIQSESTINAWRNFPADGYKVITENKGDITNIVGIGLYLLVHCEHSLFLFNRDATLGTRDKDIQMYMPDAFDTDYQEVFTSEKGFGGLQDSTAFVCNEIGYVFFDRSKRKLYRFDDKQLNDLTDGVQSLMDEYVGKATDIRMGMDKELNRLVCSFMGEASEITLSYSFITNSWISLHNYTGKYYNTKTELYITKDSTPNTIAGIERLNVQNYLDYSNYTIPMNKNPFYLGDKNTGCAVVDLVFNLQFETIKVLNFITYMLQNNANINYSGNKILIFTNSSISTEWDVSTENRDNNSHVKPYYEHGRWNFNYFRSLVATVLKFEPVNRLTGKYNYTIEDGESNDRIVSGEPYKRTDALINGKYIGIRFIFHNTENQINLSNVECYVNKYRE